MTFVTDGTVEGSGIVDENERIHSGFAGTAVRVPAGILVPARLEEGSAGFELGLIDVEDRTFELALDLEPQTGSTAVSALMSRGDELLVLVRDGIGAPKGWSIPTVFAPPQPLPVYGEDLPDARAILNENLVGIGWSWPTGSEIVALSANSSTWTPISPPVDLQPYGALEVVTHGPYGYFFERWTNGPIWRTDGTEEGTSSIQLPESSYYATLVAATNTHLFFREGGLPTVWYSHDLSSGTSTVLSHETGPATSQYGAEVASTDRGIYFTSTGHESIELLRYSDGTVPGTRVVLSSVRDERVLDLFPVGDVLYFLVAAERLSLWAAVDGAPANRIAELGTLAVDPDDERRRSFVPVRGGFYFFAETVEHGAELWFTDGTPAGTRVVDVVPGQVGSDAREIAAVGDLVLFGADDRIFGREIWAVRVGGTEAIRLTDLGPGPVGSMPEHLTAAGSVLYFDADDGVHGRELWRIETAGGIGLCEPNATRLCLQQGRFEVEAVWRGFTGESGSASALPQSDVSGFFRFADPEGVELAVKVIDACSAPDSRNFWFFAAGLTNLEATLSVVDTVSFERRTYHSPLGAPFAPIRETAHLPGCGAPQGAGSSAAPAIPAAVADGDSGCENGGETLCLQGGRFEVTLDWGVTSGTLYAARAESLSAESGFFTFFDPGNVEAVVRLIDGCSFNDRYWLFAGGLTDLATRLHVRDLLHPELDLVFEKPPGVPFEPILELAAFAGCP